MIAVVLTVLGNPGNMGFCIACFLRDIAGATKLHTAGAVQYVRPEIIGLVLGAMVMAAIKGEFKPRGGSSPMLRFVIAIFVMIGALMFLGCPLRMMLRIGGGDLNAIIGLVGFVLCIFVGTLWLRKGFSLKRTYPQSLAEGGVLPAMMLVLFLASLLIPSIFAATEAGGGPGALHAPIIASLIAGLLVGALAQRTRFCTVAASRDAIMFKDFNMLFGFLAVIVFCIIGNWINRSHILMAFGTSLAWRWSAGAAFCLVAARFASLFLRARVTPIPLLPLPAILSAPLFAITLALLLPQRVRRSMA